MSSLHLLLDSADVTAWRTWLPSGLFAGVTTNPTLLRRAGLACTLPVLDSLVTEARALGATEIHLQAWGGDASALLACSRELAALSEHVLVKLPITREGATAARALIGEGVRITFTACFEASQLVVACALGAAYAAPYLGRLNEAGLDGHAEVLAMHRIAVAAGNGTRVLAASLRQPADLARLAADGVAAFTLSPTLAEALFDQPATLAAARQFETDARGSM